MTLIQEDNLNRSILISLGFHLFILGIFLWNPSRIFTRMPENSQFLPSVRVDVVDLPDILKKDLDKVELTEEKGTEPPKIKEEVKENEATKNASQLNFYEKQKNLKEVQNKAIEKLRADLERQMALNKVREAINKSKSKGSLIKGNIVSQGTSLTGEQVQGANVYGGALYNHLKKRWSLPPWLKASTNLQAILNVWIGPAGELVRVEVVQKSGTEEFDRHVLRTVELSSPFPAPPDDLRDYFLSVGIGIKFP